MYITSQVVWSDPILRRRTSTEESNTGGGGFDATPEPTQNISAQIILSTQDPSITQQLNQSSSLIEVHIWEERNQTTSDVVKVTN